MQSIKQTEKNLVLEHLRLWKESLNMSKGLLTILIIVAASIYLGVRNYMMFHCLSEVFSVFICFAILIIALNTYDISKNTPFYVLGIGLGFTGVMDLMHAFASNGVGIFFGNTLNMSMQFWITARYIYSLSILLSCILFYKAVEHIHVKIILSVYAISCALILLSVISWRTFPECYNILDGVTNLKTFSEYINAVLMLLAILVFHFIRNKMDQKVFILMQLSLVCSIISELTFSIGGHSLENINIIVHIFKVLSFYAAYKAIVQTGLKHPYNQLFSKLAQSNDNLEAMDNKLRATNEELLKKNMYCRDIEEALLRNEECHKLLIENSKDAIVIHSESNIIFANNEAARMVGYDSSESVVGRKMVDFISPDRVEEVIYNIHRRNLEKKSTPVYESQIIGINGKKTDVEVEGVYFIYQDKPAQLVIFRDISSRKQMENMKKAAEKDKKLLDETLEFNKLITEFFSNISHELKTPLNVILGAIQVFNLNHGKNKYIAIMKQNCYRLLRLLNNLIDISKIDSGFYKLQLHNCNIVSVVEDITLSVAEYIEEKGIKLVFDTEVEEKIIACDPDKIERIILNLLSNSIKFTDAGGEINVFIEEGEKSIFIHVKDDGIGIPEDKQGAVFERFRQVDKALTRNTQGSGIGLSLVKSLVEMHEGNIALISEVGQGTEFIIELPVKVLEDGKHKVRDMKCSSKIERISIEFADIYSNDGE